MFLGLQLTEGALKFLQLNLQPWHFPLSQQLLLLLHTWSRNQWVHPERCTASLNYHNYTPHNKHTQLAIKSLSTASLWDSFFLFLYEITFLSFWFTEPVIALWFCYPCLKCTIVCNLRRRNLLCNYWHRWLNKIYSLHWPSNLCMHATGFLNLKIIRPSVIGHTCASTPPQVNPL